MLSIPTEQKARQEKAATKQVRIQVQPCVTCQAMVPTTMKSFSSGHRGHDGDRWERLADRWIGRVVDVTMMGHHHRQESISCVSLLLAAAMKHGSMMMLAFLQKAATMTFSHERRTQNFVQARPLEPKPYTSQCLAHIFCVSAYLSVSVSVSGRACASLSLSLFLFLFHAHVRTTVQAGHPNEFPDALHQPFSCHRPQSGSDAERRTSANLSRLQRPRRSLQPCCVPELRLVLAGVW